MTKIVISPLIEMPEEFNKKMKIVFDSLASQITGRIYCRMRRNQLPHRGGSMRHRKKHLYPVIAAQHGFRWLKGFGFHRSKLTAPPVYQASGELPPFTREQFIKLGLSPELIQPEGNPDVHE